MQNDTAEKLLRPSLYLLALYFLSVFLAHISETKIPLLFIYYDVPSTPYQDKIIAFLAFGWAVFFARAAPRPSANLPLVRAIIIAATGAIAVLAYINLTSDFTKFAAGLDTGPYWMQTMALGAVWLWIVFLYLRISRGLTLSQNLP